MSTRGNIAIALNSKDAKVVYNHYDSYPEYLGAMLKCYYFNSDLVNELISNGCVSSVGKFVGEKHDFNKRVENWCNFYGRDRGEDGQEAWTMAIDHDWSGNWAEYDYLFKDGKWYMRQSGTNSWHVLTDKECGITTQDKISAKKEVMEYLAAKKNQHKDLDAMLDNFLAKF